MKFLGIDNGPSGSLGLLSGSGDAIAFIKQFTRRERDYTIADAFLTRIGVFDLTEWIIGALSSEPLYVLLERPLKNPKLFKATESALRAHEATLIALELAQVYAERHKHQLTVCDTAVDSRRWQHQYLTAPDTKGPKLKTESARVGASRFPNVASAIEAHGDADGLFIALYAKDTYTHGTSHSKPRCSRRNQRNRVSSVRVRNGSHT